VFVEFGRQHALFASVSKKKSILAMQHYKSLFNKLISPTPQRCGVDKSF